MPLSEPNVERYLDEHPGFLQKYVVTHLSETDLKDLYEHWYKVNPSLSCLVCMVIVLGSGLLVNTVYKFYHCT